MSLRIAVFTEVLPPANDEIAHVSYDLLRSLAEQQHDIRVFSTYIAGGELPASQQRIEVLRPFRSWSLLEIPRLLPLMLDFRPDLIHIIHPRAQMMNFGWAKLTAALPALARLNNRTPVVTSLYDRLKPAHESKLLPLLRTSDLITVSQPGHQNELSMHSLLRERDIRLLPMSGFEMPSSDEIEIGENLGLAAFLDRFSKFIFVPGRLEAHSSIDDVITHLRLLAQNGHGVLVGSSPSRLDLSERRQLEAALHREAWGHQILFTGTLSLPAEDQLLREAWLTSVISLPPESLSLSRYLRAAARRSVPILLSRAQVDADSLTWLHEHNALIAQNSEAIIGIVAKLEAEPGLSARLREGGLELASREVSDSPANLMSRWYTELLRR